MSSNLSQKGVRRKEGGGEKRTRNQRENFCNDFVFIKLNGNTCSDVAIKFCSLIYHRLCWFVLISYYILKYIEHIVKLS